MKKILSGVGLFLTVLFLINPASAFSIDQGSNQNTDGSAKFVDPDEKMPGFMISNDTAGNQNRPAYFGSAPVTIPTVQENDSGARAFDHAFAHQDDKE